MNKHGQTLVIFLILLPFVLLFAALVIDIGLLTAEKIKASGVTNDTLESFFVKRFENNIEEEIKNYYKKNNIELKELKIKGIEDTFEIEIEYSIKSIFGNIIGMKEYQIHMNKSIKKE